MALVKLKPTSPGRRGMVKVVNPDLHKGRPFAALVEKKSKSAGRNNNGHITTRHIGGGHKHHYRVVDFRRNKDGIPAKVERLEYDPNRSAHIALLCYADGERKYIVASKGMADFFTVFLLAITATGIRLIGNDDLMNQRLVVITTEDGVWRRNIR